MGKEKRMYAPHCAECQAEQGMGGQLHDGDDDTYALKPIHTQGSSTHPNAGLDLDINEKTGSDFIQPSSKLKDDIFVVETAVDDTLYMVEMSIVGMTCSACTSAITNALTPLKYVRSVNVALLTNSATVTFEGKGNADKIVETVEDCGFDASIETLEAVKPRKNSKTPKVQANLWRAEYAIGGMTCSACSSAITNQVKALKFVESVDINLISNSGSVTFTGKEHVDEITEAIEDAGFDATLDSVTNVGETTEEIVEREVHIKVLEMYCHHCPEKINSALIKKFGKDLILDKSVTIGDPIMKIRYTARPPVFTIRTIINTIQSVSDSFVVSIYHPPTIEDRSKATQARERKVLLFRLALAVTAAVPGFIIGIVCMQLLQEHSDIYMFMMHPMWAGSVSRADWAVFILATPVYFIAASNFHIKAMKEIRALWKPGSTTPFLQRFTRFGSMNMLMSLGTSIAYFSSVAELAIAARKQPHHAHSSKDEEKMEMNSNYFDSVIFLTMFLLLGRFIEAYSKAKTGDAVDSLGKLRPTEAILVEEADVAGRKLSIDLLDVGDTVLIPNGASPPFDGTVVDGNTKFDESSLTGESKPVDKSEGDQVFAGTVNRGSPVSIKLSSVSGSSMLDQIIKIVREGQTRRAPLERVADLITSHFVPFVVVVGVGTWIVWLTLGMTGVLPAHWLGRGSEDGGWPLWSLRFSIAVFVIACPCGIGLAAPTALFVGGGLAAKNGILVKGGGEAFQEASTLDCIVFDKTGTLTQGGDPKVTDYKLLTDDDEREVCGMAKRLEEQSGHPIAKAIVDFCGAKTDHTFIATDIEELLGKGLKGSFRLEEGNEMCLDVEVIIGNERLMTDHGIQIDPASKATLQFWKRQGRSVVLMGMKASDPFADMGEESWWVLTAMFAISDPLRPEARFVVESLQQRGVSVWMLSGDNEVTARAIGAQVGIPMDNVIAGVLPDGKADKIQWLQKTLPKPKKRPRATVAMVGDGINDSPALTMADVGIAIGSGSDVAISSAEFILISSELTSMLTLIDLSRAVFRRIWFNFGWALVYNLIAMPVAAGVFYPIQSNGEHIVLDPVWASLAMACSSISVICSSLLLRTRIPVAGFRATKYVNGHGVKA